MSRILFGVILLIFSCEKSLLESEDCAGVLGGDSLLDNCDVCDNDPANDCEQDCAGIWGGDTINGCTIETSCNYDPAATNNICCISSQGCNEWWKRTAVI